MATPYKMKKDPLGSLTSSGDLGTGTAPQMANAGPSTTDFVSAQSLLDANKGKGQSMLDNSTANQVDTTADWSELEGLKNVNPESGLSSSTTSTSNTVKNTGKDLAGNTSAWDTTTVTPTTTTTYNGITTAEIDAKKANIDALKSKFTTLGNTFSDSPAGVAGRSQAQADKAKTNIATYNAPQAGFDSFLIEQEGNAPTVNGKSTIENRRAGIASLASKFDGVDDLTSSLKSRVNTATGKVGTTQGDSVVTNSSIKTAPTVTNADGRPDPVKQSNVDDGFSINAADGSITYYDKNGELISRVATPDTAKPTVEPNGGFAIKGKDGLTWHYDKAGNFLYKA